MKKQSAALRKAVARKQKGTDKKTEAKVTICVMQYAATGDYSLVLYKGLEVKWHVALLEYEAKAIARQFGIEIERRTISGQPLPDRAG